VFNTVHLVVPILTSGVLWCTGYESTAQVINLTLSENTCWSFRETPLLFSGSRTFLVHISSPVKYQHIIGSGVLEAILGAAARFGP
jgi:hypothetical protein